MKGISIILISIMLSNFAFGQKEKMSYKTVTDSFEINYNNDNFDAIFSSFSSEMQKALPVEQTKEFLFGLKKQVVKY